MSLSINNPNVKKFIAHVRKDCKKNKIKIVLNPKRYVILDGDKCNGFFEEKLNLLTVACGQPFKKWFPIFVHEYGHMTQWMDNSKEWRQYNLKGKDKGKTAEFEVFEWTEKRKEYPKGFIHKMVDRARDVGLFCEMRSVKLIKKWNLPIDIKHYIKMANAYAMFWSYIKYSRRWYTIGNEPYNNARILHSMPDTFYPYEDFKNMRKDVKKLFKKVYGF